MSADAQETPFSYPRLAPGWKHSALLGHAGINSSVPSTVGSPPWSPLPITEGVQGAQPSVATLEKGEGNLGASPGLSQAERLQPEPQRRNEKLIYF